MEGNKDKFENSLKHFKTSNIGTNDDSDWSETDSDASVEDKDEEISPSSKKNDCEYSMATSKAAAERRARYAQNGTGKNRVFAPEEINVLMKRHTN